MSISSFYIQTRDNKLMRLKHNKNLDVSYSNAENVTKEGLKIDQVHIKRIEDKGNFTEYFYLSIVNLFKGFQILRMDKTIAVIPHKYFLSIYDII